MRQIVEPLPSRRVSLGRAGLAITAAILYAALFYRDSLFFDRVFVFRDTYTILLAMEHVVRTLSQWQWPPLWNPFQVLGKPLAADPLGGVYYPPNWIFRFLPEPLGFNASIAAHHAWATVGVYTLLRHRGLSLTAAMLGGLLGGFGGIYVALDNMINALQSAAWLPWTVLAFDVWCGRRDAAALAAVALTLAMTQLGGMPEVVVFENVLFVAMAVDRSRSGGLDLRQAAIASLLANGLAVGLCAVQLLPFAEYLAQSIRAVGLKAEGVVRYSVYPAGIFAFLLPRRYVDASGGFHETAALWEGPLRHAPWALTLYLGPTLVVIAAGAPALSRFQRRWWGAFGVVFTTLALGEHLPGYLWLVREVPLLRVARYPEKFLLVSHGLLVTAAAVGLECALRESARFRLIATAAATGAVVAAFAGGLAAMMNDVPGRWLSRDLLLLGALSAALAGLAMVARTCPRTASVAFVLFAAADLYRINANLLPTTSWQEVMRVPRTVRAMHHGEDPLRIYSNGLGRPPVAPFPDSFIQERNLLLMEAANYYLIANLNAPASINLRDHELLEALIESAPRPRVAPLLAAFNTAYVTSPKALEYPGLILEQRPRNVLEPYVYRVDRLIPRAFVPQRLIPVSSAHQAIEHLRGGGDPGIEVAVDAATMPLGLPDVMAGTVHIDAYLGQQVRVTAEMETAGLVVLADSYYPGWHARVDGVPAPVVRANYFARGVYVEAGTRHIVFEYEPLSHQLGGVVSVASGCAILTVVGRSMLRRARARVSRRS